MAHEIACWSVVAACGGPGVGRLVDINQKLENIGSTGRISNCREYIERREKLAVSCPLETDWRQVRQNVISRLVLLICQRELPEILVKRLYNFRGNTVGGSFVLGFASSDLKRPIPRLACPLDAKHQ